MKTKILGCDISNIISDQDAYNQLLSYSFKKKSSYITVNNVHIVIEGVINKEYRHIINQSFISLPDGKPLSIYAKLKGYKNVSRIFGPTFMEKTLDCCHNNNLNNYFFSSFEETLKR